MLCLEFCEHGMSSLCFLYLNKKLVTFLLFPESCSDEKVKKGVFTQVSEIADSLELFM